MSLEQKNNEVSKEKIQSLMIKKLEAMLDEINKKKESKLNTLFIGKKVLDKKSLLLQKAIKQVESGQLVDLFTIKNVVQYAGNIDVEYLDENKTIKTPQNKNKNFNVRTGTSG